MRSPNWWRYKNTTINSLNNDNWCFQYALPLTQYFEEIKNQRERVKVKMFNDGFKICFETGSFFPL